MDKIKVTVICLAYNHAKYIRDALEGFVSQETGFPFEVIVHDDASTDGTDEIIKEYQARFPDIIRPVFQKENQYSKGVPIAKEHLFPMIRGEYVALCEGDDYWTDPHKLQKQVKALEACPEADICSHRASRRRKGWFAGWIAPAWRSRVIPPEEVILGGGGRYCATASLMCRREAYLEWTPMRKVMMNDYVLAVQCSLRGGMVYLRDSMAVYRVKSEGSWSATTTGKARIPVKERTMLMLSELDRATGGRYHEAITMRTEMFRSDIFMVKRDYLSLFLPSRFKINIHRMRSAVGRTARKWLSFL